MERNVTNHLTPLRTDAYRQRPLRCSTTPTHQHLQEDWLHALLALHCQCLLFLSLYCPTIRDLFHMRPCPIVANDRAERMLKKRGRGMRAIEQNNPIWWPSYYPAIVVQQRKGCRQKFNYLPNIWEGNLNRCRAKQEMQNTKCKS